MRADEGVVTKAGAEAQKSFGLAEAMLAQQRDRERWNCDGAAATGLGCSGSDAAPGGTRVSATRRVAPSRSTAPHRRPQTSPRRRPHALASKSRGGMGYRGRDRAIPQWRQHRSPLPPGICLSAAACAGRPSGAGRSIRAPGHVAAPCARSCAAGQGWNGRGRRRRARRPPLPIR